METVYQIQILRKHWHGANPCRTKEKAKELIKMYKERNIHPDAKSYRIVKCKLDDILRM